MIKGNLPLITNYNNVSNQVIKGDVDMVKKLVEYLQACDDAYYNTSNPIVSDDTYDALVETLRRLDSSHPYLEKVGAKVHSNKVGRLIPMGTLTKYHKDEEVLKWLKSEEGEILLSPKYDGFAIELVYNKGNLISASTRGDGIVGEDVLAAVMRIESIPISLPEEWSVTVRGEAIIPLMHHDHVKDLGYSAMRNAVPGIVRSNRVDALGYVDFVAYEFIDDCIDRVSQREKYKGIFIIEDYHCLNYQDIDSMQSIREKLRSNYYYELDGVVLKTRIILDDDLLNPSHMVAWKYESKLRETVLREIEFNVGATGAISVVGIFDSVEFQGAKLTRASFGSLNLYREMRPAVGDIIEVSRRGDIIPWIEGVAIPGDGEYQELMNCPSCGSLLVDDKCTNTQCKARVKLKLLQYIQGAKIKGLGQSLVNMLVDSGMVKSLCDVYDMEATDILSLPRQGNSVVEKWKQLQNKRLSPLEFLCAYPIEGAGKAMWETLLIRYSLSEIIDLTREELLNAKIRGIGESKINNIISQLEEYKIEMKELMIRLGL